MKKPKLFIELAKDDHSRQVGLMHRRHLAENAGMLFCFASEQHRSFWMKDTYVPLDIAFVSSKGKILEIHPLYPLSTRSVKSANRCKYALEVNRGWFESNGVRVGSYIFGSNTKIASANEQAVALDYSFEQALEYAVKKGWNVIVSYNPKGKISPYRANKNNGVPYRINFEGTTEENGQDKIRSRNKDYMADYEFVFNDGGIGFKDVVDKPYEFKKSKDGVDYIYVPNVIGKTEGRNFILDRIKDFSFRDEHGKIINPGNAGMYQDTADNGVTEDTIPDWEPKREDIVLEDNVPDVYDGGLGESVTFEDVGPKSEPKVKEPDTKNTKVDPVQKPEEKKKKKRWWDGFRDMWGVIRKSEFDHREFMKESQQGGDDGNMMSQYWDALKEKRNSGMTEGEAILEYLKENEKRQKPDK